MELYQIVLCIGIMAFIILVCYIIIKLRKVKRFVKKAGIPQAFKQILRDEELYATTPKSLNAMTSLYLPQIRKDFPDFNYNEYRQRTESLVKNYLLTLAGANVQKLADTPFIKEQAAFALVQLGQNTYHAEKVTIHRTEIARYTKVDGTCCIGFESAVGYVQYVKNPAGEVIKGTLERTTQTVYKVELAYIQDAEKAQALTSGHSLGLNCPNCGAPVTTLGNKVCAFCGSAVVGLNIHTWEFISLAQKGT